MQVKLTLLIEKNKRQKTPVFFVNFRNVEKIYNVEVENFKHGKYGLNYLFLRSSWSRGQCL